MLFQGTEDNNYYRWRVYSLCQGDTLTNWRIEPFQMNPNGFIWFPPLNNQKNFVEKNFEISEKSKKSKFLLQ